MRLAHRISLGLILSPLLIGVSLLTIGAIGCGDDDDTANINGGAAGAAGGTAGDAAGAGGDSAGSGGDSATSPEDQKKQDTCQCYIDLGIIPQDDAMKAECVSNVSDACVTCVEGIAAGASCSDMTEADFNPCVNDCLGLIAPPETSEECKNMIEVFDDSTEPGAGGAGGAGGADGDGGAGGDGG